MTCGRPIRSASSGAQPISAHSRTGSLAGTGTCDRVHACQHPCLCIVNVWPIRQDLADLLVGSDNMRIAGAPGQRSWRWMRPWSAWRTPRAA